MENGIFMKFSVGGFCVESIVAVSEFKYRYFEVGLGVKGGLSIGGLQRCIIYRSKS